MRTPLALSHVVRSITLTLSCVKLGDEDSYDLLGDSTDEGACPEPCKLLTSLKLAIRAGQSRTNLCKPPLRFNRKASLARVAAEKT